ncbi:MAG: hypothetical protein IJW82_07585 [Clostridia bacterium]|nr:hypothetical protein [Clostridia bacterium]
MENVNKKFEAMQNQVNKIAGLKLENNEEAVISGMLSSGIGASANDTIQKLSNALNTTNTNNFRVKQQKESFLGPNFSADSFNRLNKDIEAILESSYNAIAIDQNVNISNMLNGNNNVHRSKGEIVLHTLDYMNVKNPNQTTSYSEFDAKYNTVLSFLELSRDRNLRLAPINRLYLYNTIITLMNEVDTNNVNTDVNFIAENVNALRNIPNENMQNYLSKVTVSDIAKIDSEVKSKRQSLDYVRKELEMQIFNKVEKDFNMKNCHDKFARAVENYQSQYDAMLIN